MISNKELTRKTFRQGYEERELDVRKDHPIVQRIIDRKFEVWWENRGQYDE